MKKSGNLLLTALVASSLMVTSSFAAPPSSETEAPGQSFVHPSDDASYSKDMRDDEALAKAQPSDNGKVHYVSGGIALSGMRAIDAEENSYNLKMLFVSKGEYLASVSVKILDAKGNSIMETTSKGPILLVKMPSGHYTVSTETEGGDKLTRHVSVSRDHLASYVMRYPETQNN